MTIVTKYTPGQTVYFLQGLEVKYGEIHKVEVSCTASISGTVLYYTISGIRYKEYELFNSMQELLDKVADSKPAHIDAAGIDEEPF